MCFSKLVFTRDKIYKTISIKVSILKIKTIKIIKNLSKETNKKSMELARIMCSFLNTNGGVILIAFDERIDATMMNN